MMEVFNLISRHEECENNNDCAGVWGVRELTHYDTIPYNGMNQTI